MDDPLSQFTTSNSSPTSEKSKPGDADNSTSNRFSRRFGSLPGGHDKRKGLSLIELKMNEESP